MPPTPDLVKRAHRRAEAAGFSLSCEPEVGRMLAALAAGVPEGGRILEVGTGAGAGLAWLVSGLGARTDARVVSCEVNAETAKVALAERWPDFVTVHTGSFLELASGLEPAHLLFADSGAGKWEGLDVTLGLVRPGGLLVMDDMTPARWNFPEQESLNRKVVATLEGDARFGVAELGFASGVLLATRRVG